MLVSGKSLLEVSDFEGQCLNLGNNQSVRKGGSVSLEGMTLDEIERQTILQALETHEGNLSHVASALGISRAALYRRLEKYGIPTDK